MKKIIYTAIYTSCVLVLQFFYSLSAQAQIPAKAQSRAVVILGGTFHTAEGNVIENGFIRFDKGIIQSMGSLDEAAFPDTSHARVIHADGKHIYPGFIALNTRLGLEEIEAVRATLDYRETGNINPNVRTLTSYNTDSRIIPTVRSNGVLLAQVVPEGGLIPGTSSIMKLDGWNWEDAVYASDNAIHINWPSMRISASRWAAKPEVQKENYEKNTGLLKVFFDEAKTYQDLIPETKNLRYESFTGVFKGTKKLFIHTHYSKDILAAIHFAKSYGITPVIVGGNDAHLVKEELAQNNVPVILSQPHSLPQREDEAVGLPYQRAKMLSDAGILVCISIDGSWQQRNLAYMAGTSAAYGLSKEQALQTISLNPAKVLGIDGRTGSLAIGKDATIIISSGDVLDMKSSRIEYAFIQGAGIDLENKQKALYRKYADKYGIE